MLFEFEFQCSSKFLILVNGNYVGTLKRRVLTNSLIFKAEVPPPNKSSFIGQRTNSGTQSAGKQEGIPVVPLHSLLAEAYSQVALVLWERPEIQCNKKQKGFCTLDDHRWESEDARSFNTIWPNFARIPANLVCLKMSRYEADRWFWPKIMYL